MAFDGSTWDQTVPDNNNLANEIDDFMRHLGLGVEGRMAQEHAWPATQTGTSQGGFHKFVTFQLQTSSPSLIYGASTQVGALFVTSGNGLVFKNSAGTANTFVMFSGTATVGSIIAATSAGFIPIANSTQGTVLVAQNATTAPRFVGLASILVVSSGVAGHGTTIGLPSGVNSNEVQAIMVSANSLNPASTSWDPADGSSMHLKMSVSADVNRVVTCSMTVDSGGSPLVVTGTANFVIIGVVTH